MRTCANTPNVAHQDASPPSTSSRSTLPGKSHATHPAPQLQRALGNQAAIRWMQERAANTHVSSSIDRTTGISHTPNRTLANLGEPSIQPKLKADSPTNRHEQEADRIADAVTRNDVNGHRVPPIRAARQIAGSERGTGHNLEHRLSHSQGNHKPLPAQVRASVEPLMQSDFSTVRIHTDNNAARMNDELGARAFTHGRDIYFGAGEYQPHSTNGRKLLAHELTHVVQQRHASAQPGIQRKMGDGHDLQSPRFAGDLRLEAAYDDERYVRTGDRGDYVIALQQALVDSGHLLPKYGVDGIFGSETKNTVKSYQADRFLQIDGIVGPETMGDLDRLYAKGPPPPKIPPDICSLLLYEQDSPVDENGFVSVAYLTPEQKRSAENAPKVEIPGGGTAIKCEKPPKQENCSKLCGCPLPSTNYSAKLGDLAQVMEHATSFYEETPQAGQDPRKLLCPPKDTLVKVLQILPSSGGMTFLKVHFCNGPLPDKTGKQVSQVFIQQRFVDNGKQLAIKGPDEIIMPDQITLDAQGAHPGSTPTWKLEHDPKSLGRAEIVGPDTEPSLKLKGKRISSLEHDVSVSVSLCGSTALHRLTIREPFKPNLPEPEIPHPPPGPVKPPNTPTDYCIPIKDPVDAAAQHFEASLKLRAFIATNHGNNKDALSLYMTYLNTPKTGTKGVLPPRRLFNHPQSDFVKSFAVDPETDQERKRIRQLIVDRVKINPMLIPPVGRTTNLLPFRTVLVDSELMNLDMKFKEPTKRIPGLVAGGYGKDSSDAGDDVRNADGQFRVTNQGGGTLRIQIKYIFDVHDAVDFCPGAPGGFIAQRGLTVQLSRLEATPDVATYDTPFEVLYTITDDVIV